MVSIAQIKAVAERIGRDFRPRKVILFGSYACGKPTEDSDVDLLVIMPLRGDPVYKSVEIALKARPGFPMDLLVRTPAEVRQRLAWNDFFLREIVEKGRVLYESPDSRMGRKSRGGPRHHRDRPGDVLAGYELLHRGRDCGKLRDIPRRVRRRADARRRDERGQAQAEKGGGFQHHLHWHGLLGITFSGRYFGPAILPGRAAVVHRKIGRRTLPSLFGFLGVYYLVGVVDFSVKKAGRRPSI